MAITELISTLFMFSVLMPSKLWYQPDQPITINVKADQAITLVLTDFLGREIKTEADTSVSGEKSVDLKTLFPGAQTGTYILYAVPKDKSVADFIGTPLVVQMRQEKRANAPRGVLVVRVEPLRYMTMETSAGTMTMAFYYDVAPNTVSNFLRLGEEGYFDGQVFHRIIKGFVVQGGDPVGRDPQRGGTGGPGFTVPAEFNDRPHVKGVLSMARQGDQIEAQGMPPRAEWRDSASSQFFICLDYANTKALDGKYTAFGKVVEGLDVVMKLGDTPTAPGDRPKELPEIKSVKVQVVKPGNNPYTKLFSPE